VWVIERGQRLRLTLEPREAFAIEGKRFRQDLDRDLAIELCIARAIDLPL